MKKDNSGLEAARISARQAIVVAIITAVASIITTLIVTGNLPGIFKSSDQNPVLKSPALRAPHIGFSAIPSNLGIEGCMMKAGEALRSAGFKGIDRNPDVAWGYSGEYIGAVWCNSADRLVVFLAAGPNDMEARQTSEAIRRSF